MSLSKAASPDQFDTHPCFAAVSGVTRLLTVTRPPHDYVRAMSEDSPLRQDPDRRQAVSVLFGRGHRLRVLVSSVMRDGELAKERQAVAERLDALDGLEPWLWERDGVAGPRDARDFCLYSAQFSDALIMIIGANISPVTREEFEIARADRVPCFVFLKKGVERDADAKSFVAMVRREHHITRDFESAQDLAEAVDDAINRHHIDSWRFRLLAEQRGVDFTGPAPEFAVGPSRTGNSEPGPGHDSEAVSELLAALDDLGDVERTLHASHLLQESVAVGFAGVQAELSRRIELDSEGLTKRDHGWALNALALAANVSGDQDEAEQHLQEMERLGREIGDDQLVGIALQNLGVLALDSSPERARDLFEQAEERANAVDDEYQLVQLRLNRVNAAISELAMAEATRLLDEVEPIVRAWGGHLLAAVNATRGIIASQLGEYERAEQLHRRTLRSARRRRHPRDTILAWQNLAAVAMDDQRHRTATDRLERAVSIAESLEWAAKLGELHRALGTAFFERGEFEDAASHFATGGDYFRRIDATVEAARCDADCGAAFAAANDPEQATSYLERALGPLVAEGDVEWEARVLANLSTIADLGGDSGLALVRLRRAIGTVGDESPELTSGLLHQAASIAVRTWSTIDEAVGHFQRWVNLADHHRSPREAALRALEAAVRVSELDVAHARDLMHEARDRAESLADQQLLFDVYTDLGVTLIEAAEPDGAGDLLEAAHQTAKDLGDTGRERQALLNLCEWARRSDDLERAEAIVNGVVGLATDAGDEQGCLEARAELGTILQDQGRFVEAQSEFELIVESDSLPARVRARGWVGLGNTAFLTGDFTAAISHYDRARAIYRSSSSEDYVGVLGAMLESRLARGDTGIAQHAQRLVDRAQELGCPGVASECLARCGNRSILEGRRTEAIEIYTVACMLGLDAHRDEVEPEYLLLGLSRTFMLIIACVHDNDVADVSEVTDAIIDGLVEDYELPRDPLASVAELARETMVDVLTS